MNKEYIKIEYSNDYYVNEENLEALGAHFNNNLSKILEILLYDIVPSRTQLRIDILPSDILKKLYNNYHWFDNSKPPFKEFIDYFIDDDICELLLELELDELFKIIQIIAFTIHYKFDEIYGNYTWRFVLYPNGCNINELKDLYFNVNIYDIIFYNEKMEIVESAWEHIRYIDEQTLILIFNDYRENSEIGGVIANNITNYIKFDKLKLVEPIPVKYEFKEL